MAHFLVVSGKMRRSVHDTRIVIVDPSKRKLMDRFGVDKVGKLLSIQLSRRHPIGCARRVSEDRQGISHANGQAT